MDLKLDNASELVFEDGDLAMVENLDATTQFLKQKLRFFLAEWFLDETKGIPYFDSIFLKNPDSVVISNIFKDVILSTPGVVELLSFDLNLETETRILTCVFQARGFDGIISFNEEIEV
jgi:hypothetical protein